MNRESQSEPSLIEFISGFKTVNLATVSSDGQPLASYAPFVSEDGAFYIYVSQLAAHTRNLIQNPRCHIMLLRDEAETSNPFARQRLSFNCSVKAVERDAEEYQRILKQYRERFGPVVEMLSSLPDFVLFRLTVEGEGNLVLGFGKASNVSVN